MVAVCHAHELPHFAVDGCHKGSCCEPETEEHGNGTQSLTINLELPVDCAGTSCKDE